MPSQPQRLDYARPEPKTPGPLKRLSAYCLILAGFCALGIAGAIVYALYLSGPSIPAKIDRWDLIFVAGATLIGGTLISAGFYMTKSRGKG